ncbi:hypothetical protein GCM10025870_17320 [Agromyces marinus]|uniref:Zinc-finger domain-containing protein n=1 Tax=Agromyces marinus TaxID=1389020 RepID=A0ABM8H1J1_9MICO|nr:hypothetical protein GCM10025870_17320 [Agromyces marinus]
MRQRLAASPPGSDCAEVLSSLRAAPTAGRPIARRIRTHVDACAGCRAAALPVPDLAHRLVGLLPLLVLGGASGIAFLEATRTGASRPPLAAIPLSAAIPAIGAATVIGADGGPTSGSPAFPGLPAAPVPVAPAAAASAGAAPAAAGRAPAPLPAAALSGGARRVPRGFLITGLSTLAASAAAALVVAVVAGGPSGLDARDAAGSASTDVMAAAPGSSLPEVRTTEVPGTPDPAPSPDAEAPAPPATPDGPVTTPDSDDGQTGGGAEDAQTEAPTSTPSVPEPDRGEGSGPADPVVEPAEPGAPGLAFDAGEPGANGWRTLVVTGPPGTGFTIFDRTSPLIEGVIGEDGTANFTVRGSINHLSVVATSSLLAAGEPDGGLARSRADALDASQTRNVRREAAPRD